LDAKKTTVTEENVRCWLSTVTVSPSSFLLEGDDRVIRNPSVCTN